MSSSSSQIGRKLAPRPLEPEAPVSKKRIRQDDCIKVYCRIRPIQNEEEPNSGLSVVEGQHTMVLLNEDSSRPISKKYTFTELFRDERQEQVIRKLCDPLLQSFSEEANKGGLIFTYGVTNSGKTHTVLGTDDEPGILQYLFQQLPKPFLLLPVEVYNDEFFPLVLPRTKIHLLECSGMMEFKDYDQIEITNDNLEGILTQIKNNRSQKSTVHNAKSSRSHAIFRIQTKGRVLGVVDLAGSERVREGCTHEQTTNINRSLLTLGRCITCMREAKHDRSVQIPFRQSRLTMALAEYFTPRHRLTMVVNINPARSMINETVNVLEYAAIARDIKPSNTPAKSRYRNINNSNNKMLVTLEQTKSDGGFDFSLKKQPSIFNKLESASKNPLNTSEQEHLRQLREYIINSNVNVMKSSYYEKHQMMNSEFNSYFEREMQQDQDADDMMLRSIKDSLTASLLKRNHNTNSKAFDSKPQDSLKLLLPIKAASQQESKKMEEVVEQKEQAVQVSDQLPEPKPSDASVEIFLPKPQLSLPFHPEEVENSVPNKKDSEVIVVKEEPTTVLDVMSNKLLEDPEPSSSKLPDTMFQSEVKQRPGLFERVMSPFHSIKNGVLRIWDRISPAKLTKQQVCDASQLVLQKNGKLMSRRSSQRKGNGLQNDNKNRLCKNSFDNGQVQSAMKQNHFDLSNTLPQDGAQLLYPSFDDYGSVQKASPH